MSRPSRSNSDATNAISSSDGVIKPDKSDQVDLLALRSLEDRRDRHHHAEIDDFPFVALQHHADDVLADVVDVALHGRHAGCGRALRGGLPLRSASRNGIR